MASTLGEAKCITPWMSRQDIGMSIGELAYTSLRGPQSAGTKPSSLPGQAGNAGVTLSQDVTGFLRQNWT